MIYKIKQGESVVMTVARVERDVPSTNPKYGPSHKFVGRTATDPDAVVFMSPAAAERQLARRILTLDTVVGETIEFAKPGEYLDINYPISTGGIVSVPSITPPATTSVAPADPATREAAHDAQLAKLGTLHRRCLRYVLEHEVPLLSKADVGGSPESVSALTAQLFIAATQAGLHR